MACHFVSLGACWCNVLLNMELWSRRFWLEENGLDPVGLCLYISVQCVNTMQAALGGRLQIQFPDAFVESGPANGKFPGGFGHVPAGFIKSVPGDVRC